MKNPLTGTPFGLSTSPSARCRRVPCAASHASSERGAAASVLCAARRSTRSVPVTWGAPCDAVSDPGILHHRLRLLRRNTTRLGIEDWTEGAELVLRL